MRMIKYQRVNDDKDDERARKIKKSHHNIKSIPHFQSDSIAIKLQQLSQQLTDNS